MIEYLPKHTHHRDLHLNQYGMEQCVPGHYFGPAVRDHYLIHFVLSGSGMFETGRQTYRLSQGQGFLICPHTVTYYQADSIHPWKYCWIGFSGLQAEIFLKQAGLHSGAPIFAFEMNEQWDTCLSAIMESKQTPRGRDLRLTGLLYLMLSLLVQSSAATDNTEPVTNDRKQFYVNQVLDFIEMNYSNRFSVSDVADFVGLNRSYLCSLFKDHVHSSIQSYLVQYRIQKACELMKQRELSIGDISRSVGYEDPLLFSKMFRKAMGVPPKQYRTSLLME
ncbi:AraC family transcriptional regulator [Paenibacillus mucilaginosus]|uniref:Transcriptional regulator, AraC family n=1 Tax=Paenibacillus mucilaginosus (strain KNP414) TaxID=1036673 RepID=F8FE10_PAEMK|nr:AraC family transcriptional regulator [Paenibacillus mucilaginosus]AEI43210.1 transcriptional regulator, AraC family [Paenibacillus mucilaginosus KNP414]MCG7212231.1 AraC family transcriptional regulator [Paenibacillus mucilaginosus]WDM24803.1 AraC family transcriptional regulator [Paenibacillus mucilaginosus]